MRRRCELCLFFDTCDGVSVNDCDCFTDTIENETEEDIVEVGRAEFYKEWVPYVLEYDDDYFFNQ